MIHIIGDSHAESFRGHIDVSIHVIGRATAHNLIKDNSTTNSKHKTLALMNIIPKRDVVAFVLGEIDCRVHIYQKYMEKNQTITLEELIEKTVNRYISFLKQFKEHKIAVVTIPPAGYEGNAFRYPFFGSPKIRAYINKTYNEILIKICRTENISYVDIYDKIALPNGLAKPEYLRDQLHLNHRATRLIVEELKRLELQWTTSKIF